MTADKKSRYTEAQAKAAKKYLKESVEDVRIRVPKGQKIIFKKKRALSESFSFKKCPNHRFPDMFISYP